MRFYKYHGTGNDFILADNREGNFSAAKERVAGLCNRHLGIGADGLILLESLEGYDFSMRYFNSDGNESTMCGNGGRCITAFADFLSHNNDTYHFRAIDGNHAGIVLSRKDNGHFIRLSLNEVKDIRNWGDDFILNTGSPHLVRFVDSFDKADVFQDGRLLRFDKDFEPGGVNVNFVLAREGSLFVRTYERGVENETLSCGTGVTASALAFAAKESLQQGSVKIETLGGNLEVFFTKLEKGFTDIWLEGPAIKVFEVETDY